MNNRERIISKLKKNRDFIDSLLNKLEEGESDNFDFPFFYSRFRIYSFDLELLDRLNTIQKILSSQRFTCRFTEENEGAMEMLLSSSSESTKEKVRESGLKEIRDFTKNARSLIVIDPYIFGGKNDVADRYIEEFKKSSRIDNQNLERLHLIYSSKHGNTKAIKTGIKKLAQKNNCVITSCDTEEIHDRIWIKNNNDAIVVGTSFGGIGNRVCFILELPKYDLEALMDLLNERNYLTNRFE